LFVRKILSRNSEGQIDDLDPLLEVDDAFAPHGVEIGEWLFRDSFPKTRSLALESKSQAG
jgi:hypothetical protein